MKKDCRPSHPNSVRFGFFYRKSDSRIVPRFQCRDCLKSYSLATHHPCYRQKKRHKNDELRKALVSGVSLRRAARNLNLSRTTVARKLIFLGAQCRAKTEKLLARQGTASIVEFDDLETAEHSKYKPISVTLAVEHRTRRILGFAVARMPAKGLLAKIARKKYPPRKDERPRVWRQFFQKLKSLAEPDSVIKSDQNPFYPAIVKEYFPKADHIAYKGRRGCVTGQGELKEGGFDPLFSLNHTCAMFRANINRLFRLTWCTTKKMERLADHIAIYVHFHNTELIPQSGALN